MQKRYPALSSISASLKFISVLIILAGVAFSLWMLLQGNLLLVSRLLAALVMIGSLLIGIITYAFAESIACLIDIESNTRATESNTRPKNSILEKQRQIAELQSQIAEELKNK